MADKAIEGGTYHPVHHDDAMMAICNYLKESKREQYGEVKLDLRGVAGLLTGLSSNNTEGYLTKADNKYTLTKAAWRLINADELVGISKPEEPKSEPSVPIIESKIPEPIEWKPDPEATIENSSKAVHNSKAEETIDIPDVKVKKSKLLLPWFQKKKIENLSQIKNLYGEIAAIEFENQQIDRFIKKLQKKY